jgi:hypothetical protein
MKLKMVKNKKGDSVPFYAADGKGKMRYGGKVKMKKKTKMSYMKAGGPVEQFD